MTNNINEIIIVKSVLLKKMGRNRKVNKKVNITLRVDSDVYEELVKDGVNKSRLFSISGKKYLRKKKQENSKKNN